MMNLDCIALALRLFYLKNIFLSKCMHHTAIYIKCVYSYFCYLSNSKDFCFIATNTNCFYYLPVGKRSDMGDIGSIRNTNAGEFIGVRTRR